MTKSILIVEGEETLRESIKRTFENEGFTVDGAKSAEEGLALLEATAYDVVLSDIILPGMDALGLLTKARELRPEQIFIVLADHASIDASVEALRAGAYDFLIKPALHEEVKQTVRNALLQKDLQAENAHLKRELNQRLLVSGDDPVQGPSFEGRSLDRKLSIEDYTKAFIQNYQGRFNEQQLAEMLGITRKSLWEKRKKWRMPKER